MAATYTAYVEWDPETALYVGTVPGLPGAHTQAATLDELRSNLSEVVELCLESYTGDTLDLPVCSHMLVGSGATFRNGEIGGLGAKGLIGRRNGRSQTAGVLGRIGGECRRSRPPTHTGTIQRYRIGGRGRGSIRRSGSAAPGVATVQTADSIERDHFAVAVWLGLDRAAGR
jgi:predicted RNase H-like HicB family nuclease